MAGFEILEDIIYMFYIRCNSLEAYAPADIADAAQQIKTKYGRKFRSMDDVAGEDVSVSIVSENPFPRLVYS